jgi:hypothetical protein
MSSGMWHRVGLLHTDVSEKHVPPTAPSCLALSEGSGAKSCSQSVSHRIALFLSRFISSTLKLEATRSSETSVYNKPTRSHISEDGTFHNQRRENLKSYEVGFG